MAIIRRMHKDGSISYIARVKDSCGKWYKAKAFDKLVDAKRHDRELKAERDNNVLALSTENKKITLNEYWEQWFEECRYTISEGWKQKQRKYFFNYINPRLGNKRLLDINNRDLEGFMKQLKDGGLGQQMLLHIYNLLHKMYEDAINIFELTYRNPVLKRFRPKIIIKEREFLSPEESKKLMEAVKDDLIGPTIWLQLLAGLRPSEAIILRVGSINFNTDTILIREAYDRCTRKIQPYPKQKNWGKAPIPPALKKYLTDICDKKQPEDFIVDKGYGSKHMNYEYYNQRLKILCAMAGVKIITSHELRHSATEIYYEAGASAEDLRRLLNQKSLSATARYIHRSDSRLQSIAAKIGL